MISRKLVKKILFRIKKKHIWSVKRLTIRNEDGLAKIQSRVRRRAWRMGYNSATKEFNERVDEAISKICMKETGLWKRHCVFMWLREKLGINSLALKVYKNSHKK